MPPILMVEGTGFEPVKHVSATDLQSVPINRSGTPPDANMLVRQSPRGDSNPLTYRLQVGCATVAPLGHARRSEQRLFIIDKGIELSQTQKSFQHSAISVQLTERYFTDC